MKTLSFDEMQAVNGGGEGNKEYVCAAYHLLAIAGLFMGPAGWYAAAGLEVSAYDAGCFTPTN